MKELQAKYKGLEVEPLEAKISSITAYGLASITFNHEMFIPRLTINPSPENETRRRLQEATEAEDTPEEQKQEEEEVKFTEVLKV